MLSISTNYLSTTRLVQGSNLVCWTLVSCSYLWSEGGRLVCWLVGGGHGGEEAGDRRGGDPAAEGGASRAGSGGGRGSGSSQTTSSSSTVSGGGGGSGVGSRSAETERPELQGEDGTASVAVIEVWALPLLFE